MKSLVSTFSEPNQLTEGNVTQSGIRYSAKRSHDTNVHAFMDFSFFKNKLRCLVEGAHKDDVSRAIEMTKEWRAKKAAQAAGELSESQIEVEAAAAGTSEAIDGKTVRVVFELNVDMCPNTCKNFLRLCTDGGLCEAETHRDAPTAARVKTPAVYKGTYMHKLLPGFIVAGGDVVGSSGLNNFKSALGTGGWFRDESLQIPHDQPGLLSMVNSGADSAGAQFFVTLDDGQREKLDGRHCCFGKAVEGFEEFHAELKKCLISGESVLASCVVISDCGTRASTA